MPLDGQSVYFLGKLAASNRKEAAEIVRLAGGHVAKKLTPKVGILVVGEGESARTDWNHWQEELDNLTRDAFEAGRLEIVPEAEFWSRCRADKSGAGDEKAHETLYTPSMLAELTGVSLSVVRHLQTRGILVPVRRIHRLPYFDHEGIAPLKIVRSMLDAGFTQPRALDRLTRMRRFLPHGQVDVRVRGKDVLFVTESGPVDQDGQHCFAFVLEGDFNRDAEPDELLESGPTESHPWGRGDALQVLESVFESENSGEIDLSRESICEAALQCENAMHLEEAAELYRTALAVGGPDAQVNFQLAEVLYRLADLSGARERYFMAIELDEEFVEARANLGCVLVEQGNDEWAAAAFRGALKHHPDYAEVHFHLGMLLHRVGLPNEAREHLRIFLELAPDSPWADRVPSLE